VTKQLFPGRNLAVGTTMIVLTALVFIPLAMIVVTVRGIGAADLMRVLFDPRSLAAYRLSFGAAIAAALVNMGVGLLVAWVLTRCTFPGKRILDAVVDVPFALPTAVTGITLATLYGPKGWIGAGLERHGIHVAFTPLGIGLALAFIGLPFVVRTVQPVLAELPRDYEEMAELLGAGAALRFFRITLPLVLPALLTGFALALARGLGEYGSVIFISGNMPGKTEIAPLLIVTRLEQYDYAGAAAVATVMLVASFALLLVINTLGRRASLARSNL
jgi:sulfate/thiosulfate transport system permease protein